ncbi:hypothetical protein DH2020_019855 [Rehmannia glutinosa]|uniref:START domain-containing protein n=1 Tax=Rehmannia glutinosa TaxID=99300 RepID=A0ABR0WEF3_REHGL
MEAFVDILVCAVPIWLAVMIGLLIGWSWRPRWTGLVFLGFRSKLRFIWTLPPGLGARRFWLAFTALSAFSLCRGLWFRSRGMSRKLEKSSSAQELEDSAPAPADAGQDLVSVDDASRGDIRVKVRSSFSLGTGENVDMRGSNGPCRNCLDARPYLWCPLAKDLDHLLSLLDGKDGEMAWQSMMERSTSNMTYQAWRHEPEMGPTVYRSKTIFEEATPELVRDFFWDDEFRPKWDPMLVYVKILEECPNTGMMIVHWIKKGVPYPTLPRRDKPRRVDLYFSSWVIKPVQSRRGDGSACEVTLIHYEDMGIPKDVAKLGVRHGMWGTVKKLHAGFRTYQNARKLEASLTRCALNAKITTKVSFDEGTDSEDQLTGEEEKNELVATERQNGRGGIDWKWVAIGGAVAVVCGLQTGLIGRAVLIGAGHRIARRRGNHR